jgi:hypothetical protein
LTEEGYEASFTNKKVVICERNGEVKMIGEHCNGLYLLTKVDVKLTEGAEFHKDYNVLEKDQKMKVDKENLMDRSWDKEAKYDQIRKKVVKKGHGLLTSIQDDLGEDKYTISSKRRFEKVAGIDIKNQDTIRCSGRNKRTKKIDGNRDTVQWILILLKKSVRI